MKRVDNIFDLIVDFDNLCLASHKAFRSKSFRGEVIYFRSNFIENIESIMSELLNDSFDFGSYRRFVVYEPKERIICAAPLRQRVVHHAIMNVCHQYFDRHLIFDCYASRPQKGTHRAVRRVAQLSKNYSWFVKLDVRKFFDSIDHEVLKYLLQKIFKDNRLLTTFDRIIDSYGNGIGLPIGNLTSQYFANHYLSSLDHFMKESEKAMAYVRYMDDVIIMGTSKVQVRELMQVYRQFAKKKLKLDVKPPIVGRVCCGIPFLGYKVFRDRIFVNGRGKRRFKTNFKMLQTLFERSLITEREFSDRIVSNLSYVNFADSNRYRKKIFG